MAATEITTGLSQVVGVKYTYKTDVGSDWANVPNSTYFYDLETNLPYYKNAIGTVINVFGGGGNTIYTASDSLTGDRTVTLDGNDLDFSLTTGVFSVSKSLQKVKTDFSTHTALSLDNGTAGGVWSFTSANSSTTFNQDEFAISNGSNTPIRINNITSVALGNVGKADIDTSYNVQTAGDTLIGGNLDTKSETNEISLNHTNYPKLKISNGTQEYWLIEGNGTGSTFASGDLYLYDSTNADKRITIKQNNGGTIVGGDTLIDNGKFEMNTTTNGILLPRLTTAEKIAISAPDLNLVVFDTTLNSLQRWNGSVWVALASGFGLIEVFRSGDNGEPNFFSDLQSALETCKSSGSRNYVKIYGNITLTSGISMSYEGSGTGNGYLYESLTLDLNGFTITNNQTDNSKVIYNRLNGGSLNILNGSLIRTNGNGVDFSLYAEHNSSSSLTLNNVTVYCENGWAGYLVNVSNINLTSFKNFCDFGGSLFITDSSSREAIKTVLSCSIENFTTVSNGNSKGLDINTASKARNFKSISTGSGYALESLGEVTNFYCENTSTGGAVRINGGDCSHFTAKAVSSYAVNIGNTPKVTHFTAKSITGVAILANSGGRIENAEAISASSSYTCWIQNGNNVNSVKSENTGTGSAFFLETLDAKTPIFTDLIGIASGNSACIIKVQTDGISTSLYNSTMQSNLDTSSGHSINIINNTGSVDISTCVLKVKNSGANNITGTTTSIDSTNNTLVGATTPINSSVTINASTDLGNGNRQY